MNNQPSLLIIDDEIAILKTLQEALVDEGFRVTTLNEASSALDLIGQLIPDLIFLDIFMPNNNGLELLKKIKCEYPEQKVIIISGFGNIPIALDAIKQGALDFIEKPLNLDEILTKINFLKPTLPKDETKQIVTSYHEHGIIGQSYLFKEMMLQVDQVVPLNFPILIYGEHGTGKSLIARYMHNKSKQSPNIFVEFDALQNHKWSIVEAFFKEAKNSTLFVKNIHALSLDNQKQLYTELQLKTDNKIIASSSVSLFKLMRQGQFNAALFHALHVSPLEIPSLNKRRYDIPLLADHYLKEENIKQGKTITFATESIRLLRNQTWIGNNAELKQLVEKIVHLVHNDNAVINPDDIEQYLSERNLQFIEEQVFTSFNSLQEAVGEFEKKFLLHVMKKNNYDINQVSDRLNLDVPQLHAKMLELNVELKR